jgi:hypothetical protein
MLFSLLVALIVVKVVFHSERVIDVLLDGLGNLYTISCIIAIMLFFLMESEKSSVIFEIRKRELWARCLKHGKRLLILFSPAIFILGATFVIGIVKLLLRIAMITWPHHRFSTDVDAAIITSLFSFITLTSTLIVTALLNRKTQLAMISQSNSQLRDYILMKRIDIYPLIGDKIIEIIELVKPNFLDSLIQGKITELMRIYSENKFHLSKELRIRLNDLRLLANEFDDGVRDGIERKKFLEICERIVQQIESELDLESKIDNDLKFKN